MAVSGFHLVTERKSDVQKATITISKLEFWSGIAYYFYPQF